MKIIKFNVLVIVLLSVFYLGGCSGSNNSVEDGLVINRVIIGYGGELDNTVVSYSLNIWNKTKRPITIKSVEPVIADHLNNRIDKTKLINAINQTIYGNSGETIKGSFNVDTFGLDKKDIIALNIDFTKFKVITEQEIELDTGKH